jgi:hypothetical protein
VVRAIENNFSSNMIYLYEYKCMYICMYVYVYMYICASFTDEAAEEDCDSCDRERLLRLQVHIEHDFSIENDFCGDGERLLRLQVHIENDFCTENDFYIENDFCGDGERLLRLKVEILQMDMYMCVCMHVRMYVYISL